jgi:hypothetical protein
MQQLANPIAAITGAGIGRPIRDSPPYRNTPKGARKHGVFLILPPPRCARRLC